MKGARGFTLIELLVVCAIVVLISTVILVDNNKFGGQVTLENLAYDVALSVRQAQVYGIAVKQFGANNFSAGFGMHFTSTDPTDYYLFADTDSPASGVYRTKTPTEIVQKMTLQQGYTISSMCVVQGGATCSSVSTLDILFIRPEPSAYISAATGGNTPVSCLQSPNYSSCYTEARVTLQSPKGGQSTVYVDATGQISVGPASVSQ